MKILILFALTFPVAFGQNGAKNKKEIDPYIDDSVFIEGMKSQATNGKDRSTYITIAKKMPARYRLLFLTWSCEGKPFKLSDFVPAVEERRILTEGWVDDVGFPGKANEELCKRLNEQNVLDPNVVNLNDAVRTYLSSAKNQAKCSVAGFEKWNQKRIERKALEGRRSKIDIFNQVPGFKMKIQLSKEGAQDSLISDGKGTLSYETTEGVKHEIPVSMEARGGIRANWCKDFPPFKMLLPKDDKSPLFKGADRDMKVVTQCHRNTSQDDLRKVYREYAVYRILEASGLVHFKAQLIEMEYLKADGSVLEKGPAIFIENQKDAFDRMTDKQGNLKSQYLAGDLALAGAEDLVQNPDWSKGHNTRDISGGKGENLWVAYDFDLTNLVTTGSGQTGLLQGGGWNVENYKKGMTTSPEGRKVAESFVANLDRMLEAVSSAPISDADKKSFTEYLQAKVASYGKILEK